MAIANLKIYVPSMKVNKTVLKSKGLGFNIIQANILKIVLSIKDEIIVEKLFLIHKYFLLVNLDNFKKNQTSKN